MTSLLIFPLLLAAPQDVSIQDICAKEGACRKVATVRLEDPGGKVTTLDTNMTLPWVAQGNVVLTPGESVTVALDAQGGELVPRLVRSGAASEATKPGGGEIRFSMGASSRGMIMLTVESSRTDTLDYAAMIVTEPGGPQRTSVCSLQPGIAVFESWQAPIYQAAFWSFRPTTEPGCKTLSFPKKD